MKIAVCGSGSTEDKAIEQKAKEIGKEITFDQILLLEKNKKVEIGQPLVKSAKMKGEVKEQGKGKKVIVFKYKAKKRYKVKKGHRQPFTLVEIKSIGEK